MSLNQSMNIAVSSLQNNSYALVVVSQNIANLNVDGYTRQTVEFQTNPYTTNCENVISTIKGMNGASISGLTDYADQGAFNDIVTSNSDASYYNTLSDALSDLEDIADSLGDNGLNALLNEFYTAAANLEQYPSDYTMREQYALALQNVCDKFNEISQSYSSLKEEYCDEAQLATSTVNSLLAQLADANTAYVKSSQSSDALSNINSILEELSNYVDITYDTNANGSYNLYIGDTCVVQGSTQKYSLTCTVDTSDSDNTLVFGLQSTTQSDCIISNINDSLTSGSLKAYSDFLNGSGTTYSNINDMQSALDSAANAFATALNEIQTYDDGVSFAASITTDSDGNLILEKATVDMLSASDGSSTINASNISVNSAILNDAYLISAARININDYTDEYGNVDESWVNAVGNSDNATEITALQNKKICSYNGGENNCTLSNFLINTAAEAANDASSMADTADTYQSIADTAATTYANLVGVNLDEELADLIKYQRAYEASATLFSTINGLYDTILNMVD